MPLGSNLNVYSTCLKILKDRQFTVSIKGDLESDGSVPEADLWIAEKGGFKFMADNPIELLGLVAIYDYLKPEIDEPYWWKIPGPNLYFEIQNNHYNPLLLSFKKEAIQPSNKRNQDDSDEN